MISLVEINRLIADTATLNPTLQPSSVVLILAAYDYFTGSGWTGVDGRPDETERDEIDAMIGTLYDELFEETPPVLDTFPIGWIFQHIGTQSPASLGALVCDGTVYNRVDYPDLYAVLETPFIIDADTFKVDLRGRFLIGEGQGTFSAVNRVLGTGGGVEDVTLTVSQIPAHHHKQNTHTSTSGALSGTVASVDTTSGVVADDKDTDDTGGGTSHSNMPPYMPVHFYIKAFHV